MNTVIRLAEYPYLKYSFLSYLILGFIDVLHHLHAALSLGQQAAMHSVVTGIVLLPVAVIVVWLYTRSKKYIFLIIFIAIAVLAILLPGFYHGGWDHFVKILAFLRVDNESTSIRLLFPSGNYNLWFYEISGVLEFVFGIICAYYLYKYISNRSKYI